jgi:hypothetical protein
MTRIESKYHRSSVKIMRMLADSTSREEGAGSARDQQGSESTPK